jgi:hypothetical protein
MKLIIGKKHETNSKREGEQFAKAFLSLELTSGSLITYKELLFIGFEKLDVNPCLLFPSDS